MPAEGFAVFDTALGPCGIAWGAQGLVGVQLPERDAAATRARLQQRHRAAQEAVPPPAVRQAIDGIVALLDGQASDFSGIALDMTGIPPFRQRLYAALRSVPVGATVTYGALAAQLGNGCTARDVGEAMGKNPFPIIIPCHRVLAANGGTGGFSAPGGVATKLRMLTIEQRMAAAAPSLFASLPLAAAPRRH